MTTFKLTRDERTLEFRLKTNAKVESYRGTKFVPNHLTVSISGTEVISLMLDLLDEYGYGIDDPAGPDGAELFASYGGGEFLPEYRAKLPKVAQDALAEIEGMIG